MAINKKTSADPELRGKGERALDGLLLSLRPNVDQREWRALGIIVFIAALLRVFSLETIPSGIHVDEAFNLLDAFRVIDEGWWPVFLPANAGRDVLYTYLQAPLFMALGRSVSVARLASALIGSGSLLIFWWTIRELLGGAGLAAARIRRVALATTALAGASYWHLHFSRFGIRAILFPPVVCLVVWAWWRVLESSSSAGREARPDPRASIFWRPIALLSLALGLAFYAHPAGRGLAVLPFSHALWLAWRESDREALKRAVLAILGSLVVALPLLNFWRLHPETFFGHASETSVIGEGLPALIDNGLKVLGMFAWAGDSAAWRNYGSLPVFGPRILAIVLFIFALGGLSRLVGDVRAGRRYASLVLLWLLALVSPTLLTDSAPNFSRAIGILPVIFLIPVLGQIELLDRLRLGNGDRTELSETPGGRSTASNQANPAPAWQRYTLESLDLWFVGLTFLLCSNLYFRVAEDNPTRAMAFDADKVALAEYVDQIQAENAIVYLSPAMAQHPTLDYVAETELVGFDPRQGFVLRPGPVPIAHYTVLENETEALNALQSRMTRQLEQPGSKHLMADAAEDAEGSNDTDDTNATRDGSKADSASISDALPLEPRRIDTGPNLPDILVFEADRQQLYDPSATGRPPVAPFVYKPDDLLFARLFDVVAPTSAQAGETITVTFYWLANVASDVPLTNAVQLVDAAGDGIAQADGQLIGGSYPSNRWKEGEIIISDHRLTIPEDAKPGPVTLRVGWYWPATADAPLRPMTTVIGDSVVPAALIQILARP